MCVLYSCVWIEISRAAFTVPKQFYHVVVRLPRPMEGNGATPICRSLQNCQFHHSRLESLEHFNVFFNIIYHSEH